MAHIKKVQKFIFNGKEYSRLKDIKIEIENGIGKIIDKMNLPPKNKLKVFDTLVENRKELIELLNVSIDLDGANTNIFDVSHKHKNY